ncbi:MAG: phosphoglucosamine mutase, partial [Planctomycetota bacterium]
MTAPEFQPPEFGTDGLRGRAGQPPMDSETLRRVGAALGVFLQKAGPELKRVLVGNDGRESSDWILEALAQGLCATDV